VDAKREFRVRDLEIILVCFNVCEFDGFGTGTALVLDLDLQTERWYSL
jgi:hypothetical protein